MVSAPGSRNASLEHALAGVTLELALEGPARHSTIPTAIARERNVFPPSISDTVTITARETRHSASNCPSVSPRVARCRECAEACVPRMRVSRFEGGIADARWA